MHERPIQQHNPIMPKGLFTLKDDVEHECIPVGKQECVNLYWHTGFKYEATPSIDLVDYFIQEGYRGLDFTIDRV